VLAEFGPSKRGATIAIITENIRRVQHLTLAVDVRSEARNLLFNRLYQRLTLGRHAGIDGRSHTCPPSVVWAGVQEWNRRGDHRVQSNPRDIGRLDPSAVLRPRSAGVGAVFASGVS
jgi:hypothetical protein